MTAYLMEGSAPCCSRRRTTATWPHCDATWSSVVDSLWHRSRDTALRTFAVSAGTSPASAAAWDDKRSALKSSSNCWTVDTFPVLHAVYSLLYICSSENTRTATCLKHKLQAAVYICTLSLFKTRITPFLPSPHKRIFGNKWNGGGATTGHIRSNYVAEKLMSWLLPAEEVSRLQMHVWQWKILIK